MAHHPRFSVVPAVYAILLSENEVLLSLRKDTGYMDGFYGLVSGHVERGENATSACIREIKEESDLALNESELIFKTVVYRQAETRTGIDFFFEAQVSDRILIQNNEPEKCAHLKWFSLDHLPNNLIPYIREAITSKSVFSESGFFSPKPLPDHIVTV